MSPQSLPELTEPIRFASFQLDPRSGVLRKNDIRLRLQDQPLRVLLVLIEKSGEVVTREELQRRLWADIAFGDFDHSLNIAINKIREVLGDSAAAPRFIETVPRRGYRFIAEVHANGRPAQPAVEVLPKARRKGAPVRLAIGAAIVLVMIAGLVLWLVPRASEPRLQLRRLTNDRSQKFGPVLTDGARLYFQSGTAFDSYIAQAPLSGGEPARLTATLPAGAFFELLDLTPDRQELLLNLSSDAHHPEAPPLWTLQIAGGSLRRMGELLAVEAKYSPHGKQIAFTMGRRSTPGSLWIASSDGANPRRLLETPGQAVIAPFWSLGGERIAFGQRNQLNGRETAWEMRADGGGIRQLLPWRGPRVPAAWTGDRLVISEDGHLSAMVSGQNLVPISSGEPRFDSITPAGDGHRFYGIGTTPLGELQHFGRGGWEPLLSGISAEMVEYSRDGQRVAYVSYPKQELWVRRADGTQPIQLTKSPMRAAFPSWSPDGSSIAFACIPEPGQPQRIYMVEAAGGTLRPACRENCGSQFDLTWAPDGTRIVYAAGPSLRSLDVRTGQADKFPDSDRLYSPRWSPDGSIVAAMDSKAASSPLILYLNSERGWKKTAHIEGFVKWPFWSRDSRFIWYLNAGRGTIGRYDVAHDRYEDVVPIKAEELTGCMHTWFALTQNDEPMILRRRDIQQVYELDFKIP